MFIYIYMYVYICVYMFMYIYIYVYRHTCMYIYMPETLSCNPAHREQRPEVLEGMAALLV